MDMDVGKEVKLTDQSDKRRKIFKIKKTESRKKSPAQMEISSDKGEPGTNCFLNTKRIKLENECQRKNDYALDDDYSCLPENDASDHSSLGSIHLPSPQCSSDLSEPKQEFMKSPENDLDVGSMTDSDSESVVFESEGPCKKVIAEITLDSRDEEELAEADNATCKEKMQCGPVVSEGTPSPRKFIMTQEGVSTLERQYNSIQNQMKISKQGYSRAVDTVAKVNNFFSHSIPPFRASIFRHTYLRLQDPSTPFHDPQEKILIFCWKLKEDPRNGHYVTFQDLKSELFVNRRKFTKQLFPTLRLSTDKEFSQEGDSLHSGADFWFWFLILVLSYKHENIDTLFFVLVRNPAYFVETRLCHLLKYMCTFDPRAAPLLTLVRYWSQKSEVALGGNHGDHPGFIIPAPASLDWMVISWMVASGYIPSPHEILSQKHTYKSLMVDLGKDKVDVGFLADFGYSEEWRKLIGKHIPSDGNDFILSVLQLAQSFFQESSQLRNGKWLLSTRHGELIPMEKFIRGEHQIQSKVSQEDIHAVKSRGLYEKRELRICFRTMKFHMLNPFTIASSLHIKNFNSQEFNKICDIMKETGNRLSNFIILMQQSNMEALSNLSKCFKISKDDLSMTKSELVRSNETRELIWAEKVQVILPSYYQKLAAKL